MNNNNAWASKTMLKDNAFVISWKTRGNPDAWMALLKANPKLQGDPSRIYPGQILTLPKRT